MTATVTRGGTQAGQPAHAQRPVRRRRLGFPRASTTPGKVRLIRMGLIIACLGSIATELRLAIGKKLGVSDRIGVRLSQHFLVWTILPVPSFHASAIWGGFVTSPVLWAHIRYVVDGAGRVVEVTRLKRHTLE